VHDHLVLAHLEADGLFRIVNELFDQLQRLGRNDRPRAVLRQFSRARQIPIRLRKSSSIRADEADLLALATTSTPLNA